MTPAPDTSGEGVELLPCPFCGGKAHSMPDSFGRWQTSCSECHCGTPASFEGRSFSEPTWNTRIQAQP